MTHLSLEAFENYDPRPDKVRILELIKSQHCTIDVISVITGIPLERVSGRVSELSTQGLIKPCGQSNNQTEWCLTPPNEIESLKNAVRKDRFKRKISGLCNNYEDLLPEHIIEELLKLQNAA